MKKKSIIIIVGILVLLLVYIVVFSLFVSEEKLSNLPKEVIIKVYEAGTSELVKEVKIADEKEIEKLSKYVLKLKPLEEHEMVNLALLQEIDIKYNGSISIGVQLDEECYCYYVNKDENISSLSKMPKGLVDWLKDNLKLEG